MKPTLRFGRGELRRSTKEERRAKRESWLNRSKKRVGVLICFEGTTAHATAKRVLEELGATGRVNVQFWINQTDCKASASIHDCQAHPLKFLIRSI